MKIKTCGRESSCDLVLEHSTVSRVHASMELAENGLVHLQDEGSRNGTFLNRNDSWIRIRKITLCIGDRIRFGEAEVPLAQLTTIFGRHARTRLEAQHFPLQHGNLGNRSFAAQFDQGPLLQKPRRNPATGKIEEDYSTR